jgi:hypothetical protein
MTIATALLLKKMLPGESANGIVRMDNVCSWERNLIRVRGAHTATFMTKQKADEDVRVKLGSFVVRLFCRPTCMNHGLRRKVY